MRSEEEKSQIDLEVRSRREKVDRKKKRGGGEITISKEKRGKDNTETTYLRSHFFFSFFFLTQF